MERGKLCICMVVMLIATNATADDEYLRWLSGKDARELPAESSRVISDADKGISYVEVSPNRRFLYLLTGDSARIIMPYGPKEAIGSSRIDWTQQRSVPALKQGSRKCHPSTAVWAPDSDAIKIAYEAKSGMEIWVKYSIPDMKLLTPKESMEKKMTVLLNPSMRRPRFQFTPCWSLGGKEYDADHKADDGLFSCPRARLREQDAMMFAGKSYLMTQKPNSTSYYIIGDGKVIGTTTLEKGLVRPFFFRKVDGNLVLFYYSGQRDFHGSYRLGQWDLYLVAEFEGGLLVTLRNGARIRQQFVSAQVIRSDIHKSMTKK